ncbi:hypothetical protein P4O66_021442, partial [Electrophorus voltai]
NVPGDIGKVQIKNPDRQYWCHTRLCTLPTYFLTVMTNDCTSMDPSVNILKFADDSTSVSYVTVINRLTDRTVLAVEYFKFLGTTITKDLKWDSNITSIIKRAQERMFFLHQLRKFTLP